MPAAAATPLNARQFSAMPAAAATPLNARQFSAMAAAAATPLNARQFSAMAAAAATPLNARQFSAQPFVELSYDILLGHDHAACMRSRPQPQLIELTHLRVFGHDAIGEIHHVAQVEFW